MAKRIVIKIGNIFCAEIDGKYKCYFQYIMKDTNQLNSPVIRVFKRRYPMDYKPDMEEIVSDDVLFYAHTFIRFGVFYEAWYKVGNSMNLGVDECRKVLFGTCRTMPPGRFEPVVYVDPLDNWRVWHVGEPEVIFKKLFGKYIYEIQDGVVLPYLSIVERMKYGFDTSNMHIHDIRSRVPLPYADIYVKKEDSDNDVVTYFYFHGNDIVRLVEVSSGKKVRMTSSELSVSDHKMRKTVFTDIKWFHKDFITEDEFNQVWDM